jgi:adhesin HecA-like repeat protein
MVAVSITAKRHEALDSKGGFVTVQSVSLSSQQVNNAFGGQYFFFYFWPARACLRLR